MERYLIEGKNAKFEVVVGLEIHAQVISNSKLFSGSSTKFGSEPNQNVSLVDAAMPGMLPVINKECIKQAIKTGLGLNAKINNYSIFDRKNYFYADLPQGYQISQYTQPIVGEGIVIIDLPDGSCKEIGIERLHLEQDAGKSLHDQHPSKTYIDLNRSGIALMEIVSKPDITSPEEASIYLKKIRSILRYLGTCDGNMEQGSLRCDVNVSVKRTNEPLGTRCEIKNLNSIKFLMQAIQVESKRQVALIEEGKKIKQETRLFDSDMGETRSMRSKEDAHDYRYFPDPDLLPLEISDEFIDNISKSLPKLPDEIREELKSKYGLSSYDASVITEEKDIADYFFKAVKDRDGKLISNWLTSELFGMLNKNALSINESPITPENLGELVDLISDGTISGRIAKDVFPEMFKDKKSALAIINEKGLKQTSDKNQINEIIDKILIQNKDKVEEYKKGKDKLFGFFVGQVMKESQGKANPKIVNDLLKDKLNN